MPLAHRPSILPVPLRTLIDGRPGDCIGVADRAFHYGDGLFETIRLHRGRPCLWSAHLDRLGRGAARLSLPLPEPAGLYGELVRLAADLPDSVAKLILTRGDGGRGYRPPMPPRPRRILALYPLPRHPEAWATAGVHVCQCRTPVSENAVLAGLKHLNRLDQVLARAEWCDPAIAEGLMCDAAGRLVGGTASNLFLVRGAELVTPRLDRCGIAGTVRAVAMRLAAGLGFKVTEADIEPADLVAAHAAFLTNALIGLWPIRCYAGSELRHRPVPPELAAAIREASATPDWIVR